MRLTAHRSPVYHCISTDRYSDVRAKLLSNPDWFLKFDPTKKGNYTVPQCDHNFNPPRCSNLYHDQVQVRVHQRSCIHITHVLYSYWFEGEVGTSKWRGTFCLDAHMHARTNTWGTVQCGGLWSAAHQHGLQRVLAYSLHHRIHGHTELQRPS